MRVCRYTTHHLTTTGGINDPQAVSDFRKQSATEHETHHLPLIVNREGGSSIEYFITQQEGCSDIVRHCCDDVLAP